MDWDSGDALVQPPGVVSASLNILLPKIASDFAFIAVDWTEGNKWIERRIEKAIAISYPPELIQAERSLYGVTPLVVVSDAGVGPKVSFFLLPNPEIIELHYEPIESRQRCRELASRLADLIGYELQLWEDEDH